MSHRPVVYHLAKQHGTGQAGPKEAKHSFAQSSLLSFLSRKRGPKGGAHATQALPAGRNHVPKGPAKNGVLVPLPPWAKEPAAGAAEFSFYGSVPFPAMGKVPKDRWGTPQSDWRRSRPVLHVGFPPGPRYGGRFPGGRTATPARVVQLIASASAPLPLAGILEESPASWTGKARRLLPAVGAGSGRWGHRSLHKTGIFCGRMVSAPTQSNGTQKTGGSDGRGRSHLFVSRTGAEAKRSFAENSLPSFLFKKAGRIRGSSWPPCRRWPGQRPGGTSGRPGPQCGGPPGRRSPCASGWPWPLPGSGE